MNKNTLEQVLNKFSTEEYTVRTLETDDYKKGYFNLLSQLTVSPEPNYEDFVKQLTEINSNNFIKIIVIEHNKEKKVIATITALIEPKFIRNLGKVCHIEDVVVDSEYRQMKLGTKLLSICEEYAKEQNCYKIILNCDEKTARFYDQSDYKKKSLEMAKYL
jgi:glucosamine-phosphate N-acetyltransferase